MHTAKRRGRRGDGYIGKRKMHRADGTQYLLWQGAIAVVDADGIKRKRTVYGQTQNEVKAKLRALGNPEPVANGPLTVGAYLTAWLEAICPSLAPATCRAYRYIVETHLVPALGAIKLDKLTRADVGKMLNDARRQSNGTKLTPRTISHLRAVLRAALQQAVDAGTLPRNVAAGRNLVPKQDSTKEDRVYLTPADVKRLMDAAEAKNDRLRALYFAAVNLGARQGELLGLVWSDMDFDRRIINIHRSLQRVKGPSGRGKLVFHSPKTKHSRRRVRISPPLAAALLAHRERQHVERTLAAGRWKAEPDFVFRTTLGTGLEGVNVTKLFQATVKAAKLPAMRFHDLRHTCASIMLAAGVKPLVVSQQLGHGSVTLTLNTYGHKMPSQDTEAADAMDRALAL
jgi:integrase